MDIKTYDLIIDTKTKHTALQVKDSFAYAVDNFTDPKAIYGLMVDGFRLDKKADEYVYMGAFNNRMKLLGMFEVSHGLCDASLLDARGVFFASTFWTKLQNIFGHCCKTFLDIVACPNWTKLQCPGWLRNKPAVKPLQTLFNCYSTRYGNGSSEFSSSCACSLKY